MNLDLPVFIANGKEQQGPFDRAQLLQMKADGALANASLCWQEGMTDWQPITVLLAALSDLPDRPHAASGNAPPPVPLSATPAQATADGKNLIVPAYVLTGLSLVPVLGYLTGIGAIILGAMLCSRSRIGHGIANIVAPIAIGFLIMPVLMVAVLTMMKGSIQETFDRVTAELEQASGSIYRYDDAEQRYTERRDTPLTEAEQAVVGKWKGENPEIKWEILRKSDGTYEIVYILPGEQPEREDYSRGVWGIEGDEYYYIDLEVRGYQTQGTAVKQSEKIVEANSSILWTRHTGENGDKLESRELPVQEFQFEFWNLPARENSAVN